MGNARLPTFAGAGIGAAMGYREFAPPVARDDNTLAREIPRSPPFTADIDRPRAARRERAGIRLHSPRPGAVAGEFVLTVSQSVLSLGTDCRSLVV
jgi:hypothetical protein